MAECKVEMLVCLLHLCVEEEESLHKCEPYSTVGVKELIAKNKIIHSKTNWPWWDRSGRNHVERCCGHLVKMRIKFTVAMACHWIQCLMHYKLRFDSVNSFTSLCRSIVRILFPISSSCPIGFPFLPFVLLQIVVRCGSIWGIILPATFQLIKEEKGNTNAGAC